MIRTLAELDGPSGNSRAANIFLRPSYAARGLKVVGSTTVCKCLMTLMLNATDSLSGSITSQRVGMVAK